MSVSKTKSYDKLKAILGTVAFLLCFLIALNYLSLIFTPKTNRGTVMLNYITRSYKGEKDNSIDVFFVGNSDVYRAVSPKILWNKNGIASCVCGKGAQTPHGAYKELKEMYERQSPSLVVIETDMFFTTLQKDYKSDVKDIVKKATKSVSDFDNSALNGISFYFPVFQYHDRWQSLKGQDVIHTSQSYCFSEKGFFPDSSAVPYNGGFSYMGSAAVQAEKMKVNSRKELKEMIALCRSHNSEVLLLEVPSASSWNYARHNSVNLIAQEYGISFLDMNIENTVIGFDWTVDSKDGGDHLNTAGAEKVSEALADYISAGYSPADRRSDLAYSQWDTDFNSDGNNVSTA